MKANETTLKNLILFESGKELDEFYEDHRGIYRRIYNEKSYQNKIKELTGHEIEFVEDDISVSSKNVLRGIHTDDKTWKLISCLLGRIYVAIVNCDSTSSGFRNWESFTLSGDNRNQLLVPPKYGTSHLVLTDQAIFHYKQSQYYHPDDPQQTTYKWNSPDFGIWWPIKNPILSQRDDKTE